ncbi:MAG TPA: hypothetical protein VD962_04090 [Rubricoccaceae bacterium]|nr:hypothetical protein [Rubricoccaceae bacterium]
MEIGFLWLSLTVVLTLYCTGAAWVVQAVAYPLLSRVEEERFARAHRVIINRALAAYGVPSLLALAAAVALLFQPPFGVKESSMWQMLVALVMLTLALTAKAWAHRRLARVGARRLPPFRRGSPHPMEEGQDRADDTESPHGTMEELQRFRRVHLVAALLWTACCFVALDLTRQAFGLSP